MAKTRKTRQEKIILQLKRELAKKKKKTVSPSTEKRPRQEAISFPASKEIAKPNSGKKSAVSILSFDPSLIRRDLFKTLILSLVILSLEFMLYLALR